MKTVSKEQIKNPLVLIAVFASLSEIAMTVTLLRLPESIQLVFVWFVMVFPIILVGGFFFVLYRKPAALFSPADYEQDEMYLNSIGSNNNSELKKKIELIEASLQVVQQFIEASSNNGSKPKLTEFSTKLKQLEVAQQFETNSLYSFLRSEIGLSHTDAIQIVMEANNPQELSAKVFELTNDSWKSDRVSAVLKLFPTVYSDFETLRILIGAVK